MNLQRSFKARLRLVIPGMREPFSEHEDLATRIRHAEDLLQQGQLEGAQAEAQALRPLAPHNPDVLALRARCALAAKAPSEALNLLDRLLVQTDSAEVWALKGEALQQMGRFQRAALSFQRAHACTETPTSNHLMSAARCLINAGAPKEAAELLETANSPEAILIKAQALIHLGQRREALHSLYLEQETAPTSQGLAFVQEHARDPQEQRQIAALSKHVFDNAQSSPVVQAIALPFVHGQRSASKIKTLEQAAFSKTRSTASRAHIHHRLFQHFDQLDDTASAIMHLQQFHSCCQETSRYRRSQDSAFFTFVSRLRFTPLPKSKAGLLPIFVTGLPGSGRSAAADLLESAANSGPHRPLPLVNSIMSRLLRQLRQDGRRDVTRDELMSLQSDLRAGLKQAAQGAEVLIDSTALNYRWAGLIGAVLPEARIVQMTRDHIQCGWAMYSSGTQDENLGCTHNLTHIAAYQMRAHRMMHHWHKQVGTNVVNVSGDALTRPSGDAARAMIEACHLNWAPQCVPPDYDPSRPWHKYTQFLTPLRESLNEIETSTANLSVTPM